jgi:hypothetical protein
MLEHLSRAMTHADCAPRLRSRTRATPRASRSHHDATHDERAVCVAIARRSTPESRGVARRLPRVGWGSMLRDSGGSDHVRSNSRSRRRRVRSLHAQFDRDLDHLHHKARPQAVYWCGSPTLGQPGGAGTFNGPNPATVTMQAALADRPRRRVWVTDRAVVVDKCYGLRPIRAGFTAAL